MKLYLGPSIWMRYVIPSSQSKLHSDPDIKMCLGSHRRKKNLDYHFTIICYFSRSRMCLFSIYLAWQMVASLQIQTLLMDLKHKASMCLSLAFPSTSIRCNNKPKTTGSLVMFVRVDSFFTLFLTHVFLQVGWPVALTVRHSTKITYFISHKLEKYICIKENRT